MAPKRRQSATGPAVERSPKRRAQPDKEVVVVDSDDDDLEAILAQIKQQEESEALAKRLQADWAEVDQAPQAGPSRLDEPILILDESSPDSDEALARRLQEEWDAEGTAEEPQPSASTSRASSSRFRASDRSEENTYDTLPNAKLVGHQDLFIGTRPCAKCQTDVPSPRGYVVYSSAQLPPMSLVHLLHASCPSCKYVHCRGCFKPLSCKSGCKGRAGDDCQAVSCCTEIRAIALFEALGGFDRQYLGEQAMSNTRAKEVASQRSKNAVSTVGPGGTGYSTGDAGGFADYYGFTEGSIHVSLPAPRGRGRGRRSRGPKPPPPSDRSVQVALAAHWDEIIVRSLHTITSLLPAPYSDDAQVYDMLPHPSITPLLQMSQLPELLASLLRNDSITDWTARSDLYNAMLALLRRMADCELTLEVLVGERYKLASSGGLEEWMWGDADIKWAEADDRPVHAQPLYSYFQKLTKQSDAFLAGASALLESGGADAELENAVQSLSLCGEIIAARDDLERAMRVLNKGPFVPEPAASGDADASAGKGKARDPALDLERRYAAECERLAFAHVAFPQAPDGSYETFNYAGQLRQTANATRNPKDRLHLVKELAVTATSLPTGIWVRVDEVRNDAIKILIAGPEGTPYAGGLFEFDCFVPLEYPHKPPLMHLRTTGGGTVRFNPNLYNCGKVCLSLLGTWPGRPEEQWSAKSTLLQVLVSIQSMILIELPWFNEPGRGQAVPTNRASQEYNKELQAHTLRWAITDWLREPHRHSLWADVIASHFITREAKIRACVAEWAKANPRIQNYVDGYAPYDEEMWDEEEEWDDGDMWDDETSYPAPKRPLPTQGKGKDLLAEFERGMQRIKAWGSLAGTGDS